MLTTRFIVSMILVGLIVLGAGAVFSQDYPNKPIRIITGGVGGSQDFAARLIAQGIAGSMGQSVIVDNRAGGAGSGEPVAKAPPDGYTVLVTGAVIWIGPLLQKMPYDPVRDFTPITLVSVEPNIVVVHPSVPAKSVKELIALAKARPGELNYTFGSIGSQSRLLAELFKSMASVKIVGISYKSDSQEIAELIGGQVQITFSGGAKVGPLIKLGKLRALAVTSAQPSALFPGLPTVAATLPGYEWVGGTAMFAPAKTPAAIINRLNQEVVRAINQDDVKEKFFNVGVEVVGSSPRELEVFQKSDIAKTSKVLKDAGIRTD